MAAADAPGVYVQEISNQPAAIVSVATAVPGFAGYTATGAPRPGRGPAQPVLVRSMSEFEELFGGGAPAPATSITFDAAWNVTAASFANPYYLHESLQLYFANGGQHCFVVSAGAFRKDGRIASDELLAALAVLATVDDVTLLLVPDAVSLADQPRADLQLAMLHQAGERKDRFALLDLTESPDWSAGITQFRDNIGIENLRYGAAYTPWLNCALGRKIRYRQISGQLKLFRNAQPAEIQTLFIKLDAAVAAGDRATEERTEEELLAYSAAYRSTVGTLSWLPRAVPPSGAVAGIYCTVDRDRGVWKAPANVAVAGISGITHKISDGEADDLNVAPATGKSINAIRTFTGKGTLVFGSRTLLGNDNEWRYVPTRRLATMIEESVTKGCTWAVFEPNDEPLWARLRASITNYLTTVWRDGALQGTKADHAFYVNIGRGTTMTDADIRAGKLIIEIGIAPVRPAEFIIIRISLAMTPPPSAPASLRPPQRLQQKP